MSNTNMTSIGANTKSLAVNFAHFYTCMKQHLYVTLQISTCIMCLLCSWTHIGEWNECMGIHLHPLGVQCHLSINELVSQLILNLSIFVRDPSPHFTISACVPKHTCTHKAIMAYKLLTTLPNIVSIGNVHSGRLNFHQYTLCKSHA